jgi:predicted transcriptional regulator
VQLEILQVLWARGEALVADVHAALAARRKVALTTIATLLRRMERKGFVAHRVDGRQFVYRAKQTEAGTRAALVDDLTERLFAGNPAALVSHLLDVRRVDGPTWPASAPSSHAARRSAAARRGGAMAASGPLRALLDVAGAAVPWLATFLLHSTVLLGAAWALDVLLRGRAPRVRATAWRTALVGGVLTATLASLPGGDALLPGGRATRPDVQALRGPVAAMPWRGGRAWEGRDVLRRPLGYRGAERAGVDAALRRDTHGSTNESGKRGAAGAGPARAVAAPVPAFGLRDLPAAGVLVAALVAAGLGVRQMRAQRRLAAVLALRTPAPAGALHAAFACAAPRAAGRVRLTTLEGLPTPVAFGVRRPEICVPPRALTDLSARALHALLAHEAAHLDARDPLWARVSVWLASVLWIQPLHRLAARRLEEASEALADAAAVAAGEGPDALASCLVEVAGWAVEGRKALPLPAMARSARLVHRVERLLAARRPARDGRDGSRGAAASACLGARCVRSGRRGDANEGAGANVIAIAPLPPVATHDAHRAASVPIRHLSPSPLDVPTSAALDAAHRAAGRSPGSITRRRSTRSGPIARPPARAARLADHARAVRDGLRPAAPSSADPPSQVGDLHACRFRRSCSRPGRLALGSRRRRRRAARPARSEARRGPAGR